MGTEPHPGGTVHVPKPAPSSRGGMWGQSPGGTACVPNLMPNKVWRLGTGPHRGGTERVPNPVPSSRGGIRGQEPSKVHVPNLTPAARVAFGDRAPSWWRGTCPHPCAVQQRWHLGTGLHPGGVAHVPNPAPSSRGGIWGQSPGGTACVPNVVHLGTKCHPGGTVHVPNVGPSSRGGIRGTEPHPGGTAHVPNLVPAPGAVDMRGQSAQHTSQTWCIWGQNPHPHDTAHVPNLTRAPGVTLGDGTQQHCFGVAGRGRRSVGVPPQPRVPAHTRCPRPLM